jgi:hypothetical protein
MASGLSYTLIPRMRFSTDASQGGLPGEELKMSDVTDEQIQEWADEAERGYDVDKLRSRTGRPRLDLSGPAQVVPVRLTPAQLARLDERVARDHISRSEALRAAVESYLAS